MQELPGVEAAILDPARAILWIVCDAAVDPDAIRRRAAEFVGELAETDQDPLRVRVVADAKPPDRRVRLLDVARVDAPGQTTVRVTLEWNGNTFSGEASGERADPIELRTAALAALRAIVCVVESDLDLRLTGVKQVRAFDAELVVASLHRTRPTPQHFVGSVMQTDDPRRAAASAVLSALNRLLGNYLNRPE
ncbi:MAG: hypothetical protein ACRELD_10835 [Longimicrobiales bacterium]